MNSYKGASAAKFRKESSENRSKSLFKKAGRQLERYFEMALLEPATLPEAWLARTRISSWPLASLVVAGGFYSLFVGLAYFDGLAAELSVQGGWRQTLAFPVVLLYLLMILPLLHRLLAHAIHTIRARFPLNEYIRRLELRAYSLNRRLEWAAVGLGALVGWLVIEPPLAEKHFSKMLYSLVGDFLVFGLAGWHIYAALARTRLLANMHGYVQSLNHFREPVSVKPLFQWILGIIGSLLGVTLINTIFIPTKTLLNQTTLLVYCTLGLAALMVLVFSRVHDSLLNQFRVLRAVTLFITLVLIGTVGFHWLEGWSLLTAFYTTIITMATVGYGDYSPVTTYGQIFTVFLTLFAVGIGGYALTSVASLVIEGNLHRFIEGRRVDKQIDRMSQHYILCGVGHLGKQIALEFYKSRVPFVVIESEQVTLEELLREMEVPYVQGDATQDESLRLAGVERAKGLVTTFTEDKDNIFVTLSARSMHPELHIIAQVSWDKNIDKLKKAGANVVISPSAVSGRRMVSEILSLQVFTLLDEMLRAEDQTGQILRLEEIYVDEIKIPALVERLEAGQLSITEIGQRTDLIVVAIERRQGSQGADPYIYTPRGDTRLERGDVLIVMGMPEQRLRLNHDVLSHPGFRAWVKELWH